MDYIYVKMFDKGLLNDKVFLASSEEPSKFIINSLGLEYDETSKEWFTTLEEIGLKGAEIVSIAPYEQEEVGRKTRIKNLYILKIEDQDIFVEQEKHIGDAEEDKYIE